MRWHPVIILLTLGALTPAHAADSWSERVADALTFSSGDRSLRARLSGIASFTGYHGEQENPGFVFTESETYFSPRLALFLDVQAGERWMGFVQVRVDRGFDPEDEPLQARLDEYAVRFTPSRELRLSLQAGQFATVIGNWAPRHDDWQNPFIGAPLPYEYVTRIYDTEAPQTFGDLYEAAEEDEYERNPILWGPSYATGFMIAGIAGRLDYAVEVKNAGPASRSENWTLEAVDFAHPALNARLGFRPDLRWKFGLSVSDSVYLAPSAFAELPPGRKSGDYRQRLYGQDVSFEWKRLQVWAEVFETAFELPGLGVARSVAGYVEARYKFTPQVFGAVRWNRQTFSPIRYGAREAIWGEDVERFDGALTYRLTPEAQVKVQASAAKVENDEARGFRGSCAVQLTLRF